MSAQRSDNLQTYDLWLNGGLAIATVLILGVLYAAAVRPLEMQISETRAEATNLQDLIQQASEISKRNQILSTTLTRSKQAAADLALRIPAAPRESDFLSQISQLASQTGLEVADYHPGVIDARENHQEMEVKVSTHGKYEPLCRFLKEIDGLPRLCRLTQLDIETDAKVDDLKIDMHFRIYFAPPSTVAKKG